MAPDKIRYGVFRLGQIWSVVTGGGRAAGFPSRNLAVAAAHGMATLDVTRGLDAEVVVQDEVGHLTSVSPVAFADPNGTAGLPGADEAP